MDVPFWVWALTITAIVGMLLFDFVGHVRTPHAPTLRESASGRRSTSGSRSASAC